MNEIEIYLDSWNYAQSDKIGLGIFSERKLSHEAILIPTKSSPKELKFGREGVGKVRESKLEEGKATGFNMHVCCGKFQINGI